MEDVPQPSGTPHSTGDRVRIYLDPEDPDAQYHGLVCEITAVHADDLDIETDRDLDSYSYILRPEEKDEELSVAFRHQDVVPIGNDS